MSTERALKKAVHHVLRRMQNDGRVAWLLGPGSEAYDQLTAAFAAADGQELEKFRALYEPTLRPQPWSPHDGLSGETIQQRDAVCEAWAALPDDLRKDPRMTRLYRALGGPRMDEPAEAADCNGLREAAEQALAQMNYWSGICTSEAFWDAMNNLSAALDAVLAASGEAKRASALPVVSASQRMDEGESKDGS